LFFSASLTPSLLPRNVVMQGIVSGCSLAAGYGIGVLLRWLWNYLQFPQPPERFARPARFAVATGCAVLALLCLGQTPACQNSIRELMALEPVDWTYAVQVAPIALAVFVILIALARIFRLVLHALAKGVNRLLPKRVSLVIGFVAAAALFWTVINGVLVRGILGAADASYQERDALMEPEAEQPTDPLKTGSEASLLRWRALGRAGREFIASGPTRGEIATFLGKDALEPIRVYAGLASAETPQARARLALEELKRVGGFERPVLIVITPTGTGWVDPAALGSVEYLHAGAVASVALQYSYLGSWLYLITGADYGGDAARALFKEIYGYWTTLPKEKRPRLYLHGLSLGAKNSEQSAALTEIVRDPVDGALWSGPPSSSRFWRFVTDRRNPGSPAWLPRFRDGSFVRFMNQEGETPDPDFPNAFWGPMRIVYLQYASDPVTFFEYRSLYRQPDWMAPPRGPDVSPQMRWYPIVTFVQLAADKFMSTAAPIGHGHVYAPAHYVNAWIQVTDVRGWSAEEIARLKQHLSGTAPAAE
jgi:uncharacterized membrane protein